MSDEAKYPEAPGAKTGGTSKAAAESVKHRTERLRDQVLAALRKYPMTADEAAKFLGESVLSVRPRCTELFRLGKITDTGVRRKNESGRSANVWRSVDLL